MKEFYVNLTKYNRFRISYKVNNELLRFRYILDIIPINVNLYATYKLLRFPKIVPETAQGGLTWAQQNPVAFQNDNLSRPRTCNRPSYFMFDDFLKFQSIFWNRS